MPPEPVIPNRSRQASEMDEAVEPRSESAAPEIDNHVAVNPTSRASVPPPEHVPIMQVAVEEDQSL